MARHSFIVSARQPAGSALAQADCAVEVLGIRLQSANHDDSGARGVGTLDEFAFSRDVFGGDGERNMRGFFAAAEFPLSDDLPGPFGVVRQGKIGVWFIGKLAPIVGELGLLGW